MKILQVEPVFRFSLFAQLPKTEDELRSHIDALENISNAREHKEVFDHLYMCLSILDSKCASLLTFNSIILAVFAVFLTILTTPLSWAEWITTYLGMAVILISSFLLLLVVWVHWSTNEDIKDYQQHALILLKIRRERTIQYRIAWYFSIIGVVNLSVLLAMLATST